MVILGVWSPWIYNPTKSCSPL